ncbi:MAG TPA: chemotaxis protein CheW [Pseudogracilibacillus sp.]|nr:chemotaxis protein CheW [Pseudogracilibacillus sp.]
MRETLENKLIVFVINDKEYAMSVEQVGGIERVLSITRVPSAPKSVKGVINLRGVITPVIDLKEKLYRQPTEFTEQTRILIVYLESITIGLIVDGASDVVDVDTNQVKTPPETVGTDLIDYIQGVIKLPNRLLTLLNINRLLYDVEKHNKLED